MLFVGVGHTDPELLRPGKPERCGRGITTTYTLSPSPGTSFGRHGLRLTRKLVLRHDACILLFQCSTRLWLVFLLRTPRDLRPLFSRPHCLPPENGGITDSLAPKMD